MTEMSVNPVVASVATTAGAAPPAAATAVINPAVLQILNNQRDSRWLTLEVCREYQRGNCKRNSEECKYAHPPSGIEVQNGRVTCCFDSIKGKCQRNEPPCKYLHPPMHLKEKLVENGRANLIQRAQVQAMVHNALMQGVVQPTGPTVVYDPSCQSSMGPLIPVAAPPPFSQNMVPTSPHNGLAGLTSFPYQIVASPSGLMPQPQPIDSATAAFLTQFQAPPHPGAAAIQMTPPVSMAPPQPPKTPVSAMSPSLTTSAAAAAELAKRAALSADAVTISGAATGAPAYYHPAPSMPLQQHQPGAGGMMYSRSPILAYAPQCIPVPFSVGPVAASVHRC